MSELEGYVNSTPTSQHLQREAEKYLPGGSSRGTAYFEPYPFFVDYTKGHHVTDVDGNRYLDFMLNATTYVLGHANQRVVEAVKHQADRGLSYSTPAPSQIKLAEMLCNRVPSVEKIRFTNSGTEGTLNAIRAARAFTGKHKIAKIEGGYHGNHEYVSVSVYTPLGNLETNKTTSVPEWPGQPPSVVEDVLSLPYNDLETTERILSQNADELACLIIEPVLSNFGYLPANHNYLQGIRKLTTKLGILLIFDEVQSFRLASGGAQEIYNVTPDLTAFGKVIGGGMPVGAWGGRNDIMNFFDPTTNPIITHSGTFNANPMTMTAGIATLEQLTPSTLKAMNSLGDTLRGKLRSVFDELNVTAQVTGIGSLFGIHFTNENIVDYRSVLRGDSNKRANLFKALLEEGILMQTKTAGALCTLTTPREVDGLVDAIRRIFARGDQ